MKRKYLIYLLTFLMAFSPAAVFADINDGEAADNAGNPVAEATETAEPAAAEEVAAEAAAAEAAPEAGDTALAPADEEVVQEEAKLDGDHWNEDRTKYYRGDTPVKGLFKAESKVAGFYQLYYANEDSEVVEKFTRVQKVTSGPLFSVIVSADGGKGFAEDKSMTDYPQYYYVSETDSDYYIHVEENIIDYDGKYYYIQSNGVVKKDSGVFTFDGAKYYAEEQENGAAAVCKTQGFVKDKDGTTYYIPGTDGKIRTEEGMFDYNGKKWYAANGGAVRTTGGLFPYNGSQYFAYDDGSVNTSAGFVTVGGKKYMCAAGGAIRTTAGVVSDGVSLYVALADGSICTTPGFVDAGGARYFVSNTAGVLAVNTSFKIGSNTYHVLADGTVGVGVHRWGNAYYYGDGSGAIRTKKGVISWNGNKYYVKKGGKITTNKKVKYKGKTYIAGSNGAFAKGIFTWKKNLYYANSKSIIRTKAGAFSYNGNRYYSRKGGKLYRNKLFTAKKKKYLAQSDGTLKAGYFAWKGKYYLTNSKCEIYTKAGIYTYNNKQYFAKKGGAMANSEFVEYKGNNYYVGSDGAIVKKAFTYKGIRITPNSSTGVISPEEYWKVFPEKAPQPEGN